MGSRIAGVAWLKADGQQFQLGGSFTVGPSNIERESVLGLSGVAGYKESFKPAFIEGEVILVPELDIMTIVKMTNVTVQCELANGRNYVLRNAWLITSPELNAADGTVTVRWESAEGDEI